MFGGSTRMLWQSLRWHWRTVKSKHTTKSKGSKRRQLIRTCGPFEPFMNGQIQSTVLAANGWFDPGSRHHPAKMTSMESSISGARSLHVMPYNENESSGHTMNQRGCEQ